MLIVLIVLIVLLDRKSLLSQFATLISNKVRSTTDVEVRLSKVELPQWWNQPFRGLSIQTIVKGTPPMWTSFETRSILYLMV